ncbi:MAG: hypothetical protein JRI94_00435 [Deltaproteobacteria bacterium]|nr:hypothetical protein [Deltaproteobacteria bacterium]MBW2032050.1 hypothetical protein [Deltaproteobacteria bacterium]
MTEYLFANNAAGALNTAIGTGDTLLVLESGDGALFPSPGAGEAFRLIVFESASVFEWMTCTGVSGDSLTVTRSASPLSFNIGASVEHRIDDEALENFLQKGTDRIVTSDPDGSLAASYFGEEVYQSVTGVWFKHTTGTEWKEMNI